MKSQEDDFMAGLVREGWRIDDSNVNVECRRGVRLLVHNDGDEKDDNGNIGEEGEREFKG